MSEATEQGRVLVVEDDPAVRRVMRMMLRNAGFGVAEAESGAEALTTLEAGGVDGVVLDLGLADKRSDDVLAWLHAHHERPPWLVVSAMDRTDASKLDSAIDERFIPKPFDPKTLVARIKSMTGRDGGGKS